MGKQHLARHNPRQAKFPAFARSKSMLCSPKATNGYPTRQQNSPPPPLQSSKLTPPPFPPKIRLSREMKQPAQQQQKKKLPPERHGHMLVLAPQKDRTTTASNRLKPTDRQTEPMLMQETDPANRDRTPKKKALNRISRDSFLRPCPHHPPVRHHPVVRKLPSPFRSPFHPAPTDSSHPKTAPVSH